MKNLIKSFEGQVLAERVRQDMQHTLSSMGAARDEIMFASILALIASLSGAEGGDAADRARGDRALAMLRSLCEMPDREFVSGVVTLCKAFDRAGVDDSDQPGLGTVTPRAV